MQKKYYSFLFFFLYFILICFSSYSQVQSKDNSHYKWFDSVIGFENTGLYNGTKYTEKYRTRNGEHKFYQTAQFLTGNVEYNKQTYYGIEMRYDIYEDQIIVNIPTQNGFSSFQLNDRKINAFLINNTQFIALNNTSEENVGFYEIIFNQSNVILYKKTLKVKQDYIYNKTVYNKFKLQFKYLIFSNKNYNVVESKKDLIKLFPNNKKQINLFYNQQKRLSKSNYDLFMKKLMSSLHLANSI